MQLDASLSSVPTVVVPCFNEASRLCVEGWADVAARMHIVAVDDGSKDATLDVLCALAARAPGRVTVLSLEKNSGKAEAVRAGMLHALERGARIVGFADADLATPGHELVRLADTLRSSTAAVVMGSRASEAVARDAMRGAMGKVFAWTASVVLGSSFDDTQCGAKFFRASDLLVEVLSMPFSSRWSFDVELLLRLMAGRHDVRGLSRAQIMEVALTEWTDVPGSKLTLGSAVRSGLELLTLRLQLGEWQVEEEAVPPPASTRLPVAAPAAEPAAELASEPALVAA